MRVNDIKAKDVQIRVSSNPGEGMGNPFSPFSTNASLKLLH
jgi:hypothetical protein